MQISTRFYKNAVTYDEMWTANKQKIEQMKSSRKSPPKSYIYFQDNVYMCDGLDTIIIVMVSLSSLVCNVRPKLRDL